MQVIVTIAAGAYVVLWVGTFVWSVITVREEN